MRLDRSPAFLSMVVIAVLAIGHGAIADDDGDSPRPTKPVQPTPDLGEGYEYRDSTLARFRKLVESRAWTLATPSRNVRGMLEAVHRRTRLTFVLVPEGAYKRGSLRRRREYPVHTVEVPAYLISKTECTRTAWKSLSLAPPGVRWRDPALPVNSASWADVKLWCMKARLRLPSEAEWEYACRAGSKSKWCCGDDPATLEEYAWFETADGPRPPVQKLSNAWGLYDMHGNVEELCEDEFAPTYKGSPEDGSPRLDGEPMTCVARGGAWVASAEKCRSAWRERVGSNWRGRWFGFRPAADLPPLKDPDGD